MRRPRELRNISISWFLRQEFVRSSSPPCQFSPCFRRWSCRPVGMQRSNSFGASWADQWDYGADPSPRARDGKGGGGRKQSGVEKTKSAAASGLRKVKEGTAQGFQWIKDKCQKKNGGGGGGKKQGEQQSSEIAGY